MDLAGHTAGNRLALLAAKAAPIQATYLGYYGTTGLNQVDYWITDPVLHPPNRDAEDPCTETRWRLNRCYVSYRPLPQAPAVQPPPCERTGRSPLAASTKHARSHPVQPPTGWRFCEQFQNHDCCSKAKTLGRRLNGNVYKNCSKASGLGAGAAGASRAQPEPGGTPCVLPRCGYRSRHLPYTGCTTTADALWMGVPVLTVAGRSMVSRQAAAVLSGIGKRAGSAPDARKWRSER